MDMWGVNKLWLDSNKLLAFWLGFSSSQRPQGTGSVLRTHSQVLWLVHEVVVSWATCVSGSLDSSVVKNLELVPTLSPHIIQLVNYFIDQ